MCDSHNFEDQVDNNELEFSLREGKALMGTILSCSVDPATNPVTSQNINEIVIYRVSQNTVCTLFLSYRF